MQETGLAWSLWRKIHLRLRKDSDLDGVTSRADELLASLETADSCIRDLVKHNAELTKTFTQELKNLAADMERRAVDERKAVGQMFREFQKEIDKQLYSVQREVGENANTLMAVAGKQGDLFKQEQAIVGEKLDRACGAVANVDGSITGIRNHLAEQNQIQRRYQEGYDFQILRNFVRQIIQLVASLDRRIDMTEDGEALDDLIIVRKGLTDLLNKNGVEQIVPVVGAVYEGELRTLASAIDTVDAPTPSLAGSVAEVIQPGYLYTFTDDEDRSRCLQPAKVTIFKMGPAEEETQTLFEPVGNKTKAPLTLFEEQEEEWEEERVPVS